MAGLVLAGLLFGSTFVVTKDALRHARPVPFLGARFLVGAAVLLPLTYLRRPRTATGTTMVPTAAHHEVRHGVLAGMALLAAFLLQTVGLQDTTASSSAFITYLLVVIVPLITVVWSRRRPTGATVLGVAVAVPGLLLLSGGPSGFGRGEWLTLGSAFGFATHIVILGRIARHHDPVRLTFWQLLTVGLGCGSAGLWFGGYRFAVDGWVAVAFCGIGATAGGFLVMVWAQRSVAPTRAALVLLLEPVFAAVLGYVAGDRLGWPGVVGAALIVLAIVVSELVPASLRSTAGARIGRRTANE